MGLHQVIDPQTAGMMLAVNINLLFLCESFINKEGRCEEAAWCQDSCSTSLDGVCDDKSLT